MLTPHTHATFAVLNTKVNTDGPLFQAVAVHGFDPASEAALLSINMDGNYSGPQWWPMDSIVTMHFTDLQALIQADKMNRRIEVTSV